MDAEDIKDEVLLSERKSSIIEVTRTFRPFDTNDDFRVEDAGYYGGFQLLDNELSSRLRSAGKELLLRVGKSILSGKFNLTTITFPIKCMCPMTMLTASSMTACVNPFYLNPAGHITDPVERMKLVIASTIAILVPIH